MARPDNSPGKERKPGQKPVSLSARIQPALKIAAILVIALTAGYFLYHTVLPSTGSRGWITEQTEVYLPDSSFVVLNTASGIRFAGKKWDEERTVELRGEAFFKVKTGAQFTVQTPQGQVTVLGTEFSVKDREDYFQVTCFSGSVRVVTPQRSTVLKPQSSYRVVNGIEENFIYSGGSVPDWFREESSFRSVPLRFVLSELELQYNVSVVTKDVDVNQLFTGSFTHKNLDIALEAVTIPVNLQYAISENKTVITVEGK
jgi:ferric-dicitrate binding protein FerR (iron transport regulator)